MANEKISLSDEEKHVIALSAELWNAIFALETYHPSDIHEYARDIHDIQSRVMARLARRANPELFN
jgi:hypothetical protein